MNILIYGGNFLTKSLQNQGHNTLGVGVKSACDIVLKHPVSWPCLSEKLKAMNFIPDCAIWLDDGNLPALPGVEAVPFPSIFYSIDSYCNPWHVPFAHAFDRVFVAQYGHVELFPALAGGEPVWLPLFAPDDEPYGTQRDIPVSFVGTLKPRNIPQRLPFLQAFRRLHPLFFSQGAYEQIFLRSLIVLNQTAAQEVNFRCFESMALGAALLTEKGPHGLEILFTPKEHILPPYTANNAREAADIATLYLHKLPELNKIAGAGQKLVREKHLAKHRALFLEKELTALCTGKVHLTRIGNLDNCRKLLSTAYAILMDELQEERFKEHRRLFKKIFADLRF